MRYGSLIALVAVLAVLFLSSMAMESTTTQPVSPVATEQGHHGLALFDRIAQRSFAISPARQREALMQLEEAVMMDHDVLHGLPHIAIARIYQAAPARPFGPGDWRKALAHLEQALSLSPESVDAHYYYAQLLAEQGDAFGAQRHLEQASQRVVAHGDGYWVTGPEVEQARRQYY